jgi:hypothetical protein
MSHWGWRLRNSSDLTGRNVDRSKSRAPLVIENIEGEFHHGRALRLRWRPCPLNTRKLRALELRNVTRALRR